MPDARRRPGEDPAPAAGRNIGKTERGLHEPAPLTAARDTTTEAAAPKAGSPRVSERDGFTLWFAGLRAPARR